MLRTLAIVCCYIGLSFASAQTLKIGTMDLPPYGWSDPKGKHGIIYELNQEIGRRSGLEFTNQILPFKRMIHLLEQGKIDLISSQAHAESLNAGDKLEVQFEIDVIAGTNKKSNINELQDLEGKNIIYHRSASYKQLKDFKKRIIRVNSYEQMLVLLSQDKELDAGIFSEPAYYYWMRERNKRPYQFGNVLLIESAKKQWVLVRKDMPENLRKRIQPIVKEIFDEGMYQSLLKKYGKSE